MWHNCSRLASGEDVQHSAADGECPEKRDAGEITAGHHPHIDGAPRHLSGRSRCTLLRRGGEGDCKAGGAPAFGLELSSKFLRRQTTRS